MQQRAYIVREENTWKGHVFPRPFCAGIKDGGRYENALYMSWRPVHILKGKVWPYPFKNVFPHPLSEADKLQKKIWKYLVFFYKEVKHNLFNLLNVIARIKSYFPGIFTVNIISLQRLLRLIKLAL